MAHRIEPDWTEKQILLWFEIGEIAKGRMFPDKKDMYKNAKPSEKENMDLTLKIVCPGFLESHEYKSGDTKDVVYKACCEIGGYCSFMNSTMFYLICTAVVCLLIHAISIVIVCILCRKRGIGGSVTVKTAKSANNKNSKEQSKMGAGKG